MEDPLALALLEGRFADADHIRVSVGSSGGALVFEPGSDDHESA